MANRKNRTNIMYKNLIMKSFIQNKNREPLYIVIKLLRNINEKAKQSLNLSEDEENILLNIEEEVKFQVYFDDKDDEIYASIDENTNFIKLVRFVNNKFDEMKEKKLITGDSQKNCLIGTIKFLREKYGSDLSGFQSRVNFMLSDIVSFELTNNRILSSKKISGTLTTYIYNDIYMYKEDYKRCKLGNVDQIFEDQDILPCENVVNKFLDILLFDKRIQLISGERLNFLLKGVPGTGKSTAVDSYLHKIGVANTENICRINIHSGTSNSDLMQGIGIRLKEKDILYTEKQGMVLSFILSAIKNPEQKYALILEEIQENSLNEILGDLIYLIEESKRVDSSFIIKIKEILGDIETYDSFKIIDILLEKYPWLYYINMPKLVEDNADRKFNKLILPNNLFVFCTTNYSEEKNILEDNLFRRFEVIDIFPDEEQIKDKYIKLFFKALNEEISVHYKEYLHPDRYLIGHANWMFIYHIKEFYRAFIKLINEFKEIREIGFEDFRTIICNMKFEEEWNSEENKFKKEFDNIKNCLSSDDTNYYEVIKAIIKKAEYELLEERENG